MDTAVSGFSEYVTHTTETGGALDPPVLMAVIFMAAASFLADKIQTQEDSS